jgi:monofunctional biosynthetic peptidoglycan transglycosylase
MSRPRWAATAGRLALALGLSLVLLHVLFALRIASWRFVEPSSTSYQRAEFIRLLRASGGATTWQHRPVAYAAMADSIKRAVVASEDSGFAEHDGVDWDAIRKAWDNNQRGLRIKGGSTISQQLAKNLLLSGERRLLRKAEELLLTRLLEASLSKERLLELYLNHVEWGEGLFGIEAAARRYYGLSAARLTPMQAARLAVMLPAPKRFERRPQSAYVERQAQVIVRRMALVELP